MVIDPYWIFAYWDIADAQMAKARRRLNRQGRPEPLGLEPFDKTSASSVEPLRAVSRSTSLAALSTSKGMAEPLLAERHVEGRPSAKTVLRVYDVTGANGKRHKPNFSFDIEIVPGADNWYIHLWSPQRSLYADLGLLGPEGHFVGIARSNRVETPPAQASPSWDERLATVGRRYKGAAPDRGQRGKPHPEPAPRLPAHAPASVPVMPAIAASREGGQTPQVLAHYQAPNVSVILPVRPMNDAAGAPAPQATLASLVANQTGPSSVRHAGSHPVPHAGHFPPAKPFIGSTTLVLEAVVAVRAPRKG
jgi:hypothetical protein